MDNNSKNKTMSITIIAIVAALALLGGVVITVAVTIPLQQQAEAAKPVLNGCNQNSKGYNASLGRCLFKPN